MNRLMRHDVTLDHIHGVILNDDGNQVEAVMVGLHSYPFDEAVLVGVVVAGRVVVVVVIQL